MAQLIWDRHVLLNPRAFATYLELVHALIIRFERFDECQFEDDDVCFFCRIWVHDDGHYHWLKGSINPLPMEQKIEYIVRTIC
jgi:hypothetical protein